MEQVKNLNNKLEKVKAFVDYSNKYPAYYNALEQLNIGENSISQLLAWLLDTNWVNDNDPEENQLHRIFTYEFLKLIKNQEKETDKSILQEYNDEKLKELAYGIVAKQGKDNIDILLVNKTMKFVCVIENKKRAKLSTSKIHDERGILRIEKYCNYIDENYEEYNKKFVYLCAEKDDLCKALTPQKNLRALDTDVEAIMESEGFAVRQYSRLKADTKILEKIREAMLSFKKVKFSYNNISEVEPYGIIVSDKYYLLGKNSGKLKLYKLNKIKNIEILDEYFEKDETFNLKEYCDNSFGIYQEEPYNVVLEFDKFVKDDVMNYHFHPTQKVKELENGNVEIKFTSGGKLALCYELFKWGGNVKIKKPFELKKYYKDYIKYVLENL